MYIHTTKHSKRWGEPTKLLRFSYWRDGRAHKFTIADLTRWSATDLQWLDYTLKLRRAPQFRERRDEIDQLIMEMLWSRLPKQQHWRIISASKAFVTRKVAS